MPSPKFLIALLVAIIPSVVRADPAKAPLILLHPVAQENSPDLKSIADDNPDRKIVEARIEKLKASYERLPGYELPHVAKPLQIETVTLTRLFPHHRFYLIRYNEASTKVDGRDVTVVLGGLYFVMVLRPQGEPIELGGLGNYEDFGTLLQLNKVALKTPADATLIWTAFNDVHRKKWLKGTENRQLSPMQWALAESIIGDNRYWYQVNLDENQMVTSAKLMSEKIEAKEAPK